MPVIVYNYFHESENSALNFLSVYGVIALYPERPD